MWSRKSSYHSESINFKLSLNFVLQANMHFKSCLNSSNQLEPDCKGGTLEEEQEDDEQSVSKPASLRGYNSIGGEPKDQSSQKYRQSLQSSVKVPKFIQSFMSTRNLESETQSSESSSSEKVRSVFRKHSSVKRESLLMFQKVQKVYQKFKQSTDEGWCGQWPHNNGDRWSIHNQ